MKKIDSCLYPEDIIKFYELSTRISQVSPNIGIIGDTRQFNLKVEEILTSEGIKKRKPEGVYVYRGINRLTIITGDVETTYIQIETLQDLHGRYFRKFIY